MSEHRCLEPLLCLICAGWVLKKGIPGIYMPLTQQVALVYLGRATFVYFLGILLRNL